MSEAANIPEIKRLFVIGIVLSSSDVNGSFQLFLAVIVIVHQLTVPQYEPAHLPVSKAEGHSFRKDQEDTVVYV